MIIEEVTLGVDPGTVQETDGMSVFSNPTDWLVSTNRIRTDISHPDPIPASTAGYYIDNFGLDGDGLTIPIDIFSAWIEQRVLAGAMAVLTDAPASFTVRMTGFALYNIFEFSTLDFSTIDGWVRLDGATNNKFSQIDYSISVGAHPDADDNDFSANFGFSNIGTLSDSYNSAISTTGITAMGIMCEVIASANGGRADSVFETLEFDIRDGTSPQPINYLLPL